MLTKAMIVAAEGAAIDAQFAHFRKGFVGAENFSALLDAMLAFQAVTQQREDQLVNRLADVPVGRWTEVLAKDTRDMLAKGNLSL